jgi:hypothetical protein
VTIFNDFLRQIKSDLIGTRYSSFWDGVVSGVAIVTSSECGASSVTEGEAQEFLSVGLPEEQGQEAEGGEGDEAEDLLAMM